MTSFLPPPLPQGGFKGPPPPPAVVAVALALSQMSYLDSFYVWTRISHTPPTSVKGCQGYTVDDAQPSTVDKLADWLLSRRMQVIYVLPHSIYVR